MNCSAVGHCHSSELQPVAGLAIEANCNARPGSPQRCIARSCSAVLPPAIAAAAAEFCLSDVRRTCVRFPSNVGQT
ncbi:unnamed protein product [Sphagnum tenellum]